MPSFALRCAVASVIVPATAVGLFAKPVQQHDDSWRPWGARRGPRARKGPASAAAAAARESSAANISMAWNRTLLENNLSGQGPGPGTDVIKFSPMLKVNDSYVDLVVSARVGYVSSHAARNGWSDSHLKQLVELNVQGRELAELKLSFKKHGTNDPFDMPPYNITFFDIDGRETEYDAETLSIPTRYFSGYTFFPSSNLSYTVEPVIKLATVTSNSWGSMCDNPGNLAELGPKSCAYEHHANAPKRLVDPRNNAVAFHMNGGPDFDLELYLDEHDGGGNFLFAVPAFFGEYNEEPAPSP